MRKLVLTITAALLVVPVPAGAEPPKPGVDAAVSQFAYATTIIHENGHDYMYIVGGERTTRSNGRTKTTAYAKRSKCLTLKKKHIHLIACAAFVFPKRVPDRAFDFDPLLDSARLRIKGKKGATAISWTGRGVPEPAGSPYADASYGVGAYADVYRSARARGKILGKRYPKGDYGFALLIEGAGAGAYASRNTTITRTKSGALRIEARYRIPR